MKLLPTFIIIGAAKSGTSALYKYLDQHPDIYMSPVKETHFFAFDPAFAPDTSQKHNVGEFPRFKWVNHVIRSRWLYKTVGPALPKSVKHRIASLAHANMTRTPEIPPEVSSKLEQLYRDDISKPQQ